MAVRGLSLWKVMCARPHNVIHAEKMDNMLTRFPFRVVDFLFCGRNSGQDNRQQLLGPWRGVSMSHARLILRHLFGNGQNALHSIEMDPVGGKGGEFDAA